MLLNSKYNLHNQSFVQNQQGKGETYSPLGYLRRLAKEVPLRQTLKEPDGRGHVRQVVSMEILTDLKVHDMSGEWCIVTHGQNMNKFGKAGWKWNWGLNDWSKNQVPEMPGQVVSHYRP